MEEEVDRDSVSSKKLKYSISQDETDCYWGSSEDDMEEDYSDDHSNSDSMSDDEIDDHEQLNIKIDNKTLLELKLSPKEDTVLFTDFNLKFLNLINNSQPIDVGKRLDGVDGDTMEEKFKNIFNLSNSQINQGLVQYKQDTPFGEIFCGILEYCNSKNAITAFTRVQKNLNKNKVMDPKKYLAQMETLFDLFLKCVAHDEHLYTQFEAQDEEYVPQVQNVVGAESLEDDSDEEYLPSTEADTDSSYSSGEDVEANDPIVSTDFQ